VTTVRTPIGPAVDAIQRVPVALWLADGDDPQGFPNYPLYVDDTSRPVGMDPATGLADGVPTQCLWDGAFGNDTALLLGAIGADPSRIPADTSALDRAALLALYAVEIAAAKAVQAQVHP
jgi:hypothetical protein